jgi:asparagine synthase (glutamine-hydrolysing)
MCGIAGLLASNAASADEEARAVVTAMTQTLTRRGPDAFGHFVRHPVALGHRRLSILGLGECGAQPMSLGDGQPVITYNGECYNFLELRTELQARGCAFRGGSDTEVVLHAYAQWGLPGLKRLEGIFALAIWDPARERLVLMRDRLGVKPLFYAETIHGLAFGSEIKAVLAADPLDVSLDDQAFSEYLWYGNAYGDRTFYRGIRSLEPGYWLIVERGNQKLARWWAIEEWLERPVVARDANQAAQQVRSALDIAVTRQLVADVPVGIFLSGGVDSSAIAASAMHSRVEPLASYAAGFDIAGSVNELPKAARVARHLGLEHQELNIGGADLPEVLMSLSHAHDEPFGDAANIPLYLMCRALQGRIKVVLQGDGGDEMFAGYRRYALLRNARWWNLWPHGLSPLARAAGPLGRRFARVADTVGNDDDAMRMALLLTSETPHAPPDFILNRARRRHLRETTDPFLAYRRAADRFRDYDPVQQMLLTDLTVQLPSTFLPKVDRATMAAGIEARVPLLDERIGEVAVGMPATWKAHGREKKIVLRNSQRGRVPDDILDGPKTGFGVPFAGWLRTSLASFAAERLLDPAFLDAFDLDGASVERMFWTHVAGGGNRGYLTWKLLQVALWNERRPC